MAGLKEFIRKKKVKERKCQCALYRSLIELRRLSCLKSMDCEVDVHSLSQVKLGFWIAQPAVLILSPGARRRLRCSHYAKNSWLLALLLSFAIAERSDVIVGEVWQGGCDE
jgi:hypothetical protein